ncbi:MAG TPA: DUF1343 domain-containing protein [Chitinophagales bacterium]|nr:DUF1343 domain-containing protein [Chitinophagales bacterium]
MQKNMKLSGFITCICLLPVLLYGQTEAVRKPAPVKVSSAIVCGDARFDVYLPLLQNKNVAFMLNQTAVVNGSLLVDTLLGLGIKVKKIFAPEHGFRGKADAGEDVKDGVDAKTGIPVISVYGNKKMPTAADLDSIDIVVFDIQDVGTRFYTFISSLHYLMEACAINNKPLIVLDRPNPNGWYADGPVLQKEFKSFVGVDPIPVVHGLTIGEYAQMVNGEKWLPGSAQCNLTVIGCLNYTHSMRWNLPVRPSPNLPDSLAVALYPSLCFFEGTNISVGRGTGAPFQVIGSPATKFKGAYQFTPQSMPGATQPPFLNKVCYGYDLRQPANRLKPPFSFQYVINMYKLYADKKDFFLKTGFFDKLAGTDEVRKMIEAGKTDAEIKAWYAKDLQAYKAMRKKYLLYPDFE